MTKDGDSKRFNTYENDYCRYCKIILNLAKFYFLPMTILITPVILVSYAYGFFIIRK